jgi:hypothetical protein
MRKTCGKSQAGRLAGFAMWEKGCFIICNYGTIKLLKTKNEGRIE